MAGMLLTAPGASMMRSTCREGALTTSVSVKPTTQSTVRSSGVVAPPTTSTSGIVVRFSPSVMVSE